MKLEKLLFTSLILILIVSSIKADNLSDNQTTPIDTEPINTEPINTEPINTEPINTEPINTITADETELITINVSASDPDKEDTLKYFFSAPFDENGTWTPGYEDAGEYTIDVTVTDGEYSDHSQINIIVLEKDRPPIIVAVGKQTLNENQELILPIEAFDLDKDNVTLTAIELPENALFVNNTLYWQPGYDTLSKSWLRKILAKLHLDILKDNKEFTATINAKGKDLDTNEIIPINVIDFNRPPKIQSIENTTIKEGEKLYFTPNSSDPDSDSISYYFSGWVSQNNYETTYNDAGIHLVTVTASDGFLSDSTTATVIIENTNRAPVLGKIKSYKIDEGEEVSFEISGFDEDVDELSFHATPLPEGAIFDGKTFSWTPNFDAVSTEEKEKEFNLNITTFDGKNSDTKQTTIKVKNINRAPEITNSTPSTNEFEVYVGGAVVFEVDTIDADNDNLTYTWDFGMFNAYAGSTIHKRVFQRTGNKKVVFQANDGENIVEKVWNFKVLKPQTQTSTTQNQETTSTPSTQETTPTTEPIQPPAQAPQVEYISFSI